MPKRSGNRPNALKHGAFAKTAILPGEDPCEFEELHSSLVEEWTPVGPTEEDAVLSIAQGVWRKRRVQKFLEADFTAGRFQPDHVAYDEALALEFFSDWIEGSPDEFDRGLVVLSPRRAEHFRQKFPRQEYQSTSAWVHAVQTEITSVLLPLAEGLRDGPMNAMLIRSAQCFSANLFTLELATDERIDAMIDRAIKRLIQTKAMKQMLGGRPPSTGDDQSKKLQRSKPNGPVNRPDG
jgi:hypothetical protein